MALDLSRARGLLAAFDLKTLFIEELGWNRHTASLEVPLDGRIYGLHAVAEKCGLAVLVCDAGADGLIPDHATRRRIDRQVTKSAYEHLIVFTDARHQRHVWQWVRRERGKPSVSREYAYQATQPGDFLIQRLQALAVSLEEEECITLPAVTGRVRGAFDVERVTKRFYDRFKAEHAAFLAFIKGIPDEEMERWYASMMLNRLMFVYFIQKKGFLNGDHNYLRNKLTETARAGRGRYYRDFLCPLFFEGFARRPQDRSSPHRELLGDVPYLNGGIFLPHQIEQICGQAIQIADEAFTKLFDFFDAYRWHLDERPLRADNEINPDVLGYIFEKYINQKQMGAYYTKEDITEYMSKNTVIPFLFDAAREKCKVAFEGDHAVWHLLQEDPDRYIYEPVRRGVVDQAGTVLPEESLPEFVQKGMHNPKARMHNRDYNLGQASIPGPTGEDLALPTETWREYVTRRLRCLELRERLGRGEVRSINDLITLNLDIRQFAQDVIESCEGPELLVAFWRAIVKLTVLDPTCGSGAFLFAVLNVLEPLYDACLERMRFFLEEWGEDGPRNHPNYHKLFVETLQRVEAHPNHRYFVLKSIIVNNLYGVDIMEEAVEICKLRLFLKLVAQIDQPAHIEPLPDIDFNIRSGNTLVGFATLDDVRKSMEGDWVRLAELPKIEEEAEIADRAFQLFHRMQTEQGMSPAEFAEAKEALRGRLKALTEQLDCYLAGEYHIDPARAPDAFAQWRASHRPFHWFAEFYGIMKSGGFDVIIGNPPWAEYSTVRKAYTVRDYQSERSGNLHAFCTERSLALRSAVGSFSFIVQLPLANSSRMDAARSVLRRGSGILHVLPFDDRPGKLFEGLQNCRSVILVSRRTSEASGPVVFVKGYQRWATEVRATLFQGFAFTELQNPLLFDGHFPKLGSSVERAAFRKVALQSRGSLGGSLSAGTSKDFIFYQEATRYWVKAVVGLPYYAKNGKVGEPAHGRFLCFSDPGTCHAGMALLNSSLFYAYFIAYGDCFHLSDMLATKFPVPPALLSEPDLVALGRRLDHDLRASAERMTINTKDGDRISYAEFFAWKSKPIIDQIDQVLAQHYGFTDEELDCIINYDIKYRMGGADDEDGE